MKPICQRVVLIFIVSQLLQGKIFSQQEQLINGDFTGMSFGQFVQQVESASSYHFYFDTALTSKIMAGFSVSNKPLRAVLQQLFNKSDLHYAIDGDMNVFITKKAEIQTSLPTGFFDRNSEVDKAGESNN